MMTDDAPLGSMRRPPHPGAIFREDVIRPLGLSVTEAAKALGVTRQALSLLLNERTDLSPEMAYKMEAAFGPKAETMMSVQLKHTMARARERRDEIVAGVRPVRGPVE